MEELILVQTGYGVDIHGQDITKACERAVHDAIYYNSMPGIKKVLPENDLNQMVVNVKLAVPCDGEKINHEAIKSLIPYGKVTIEVVSGGMATTSGIHLANKNDKNDKMYIVNASVETGF